MLVISRLQRMPIDTSVYYQMKKIKRYNGNNIGVDEIRSTIRKITKIDPLINQSYRGRDHVRSRQLFLYFVRKYTESSQSRTGALIGKDHSTVVHAEKCVKKFLELEKDYAEIHNRIDLELFKLKTR